MGDLSRDERESLRFEIFQKIKKPLDEWMKLVPGLRFYAERCLRTERYDGDVVLMVVDASFTSIGLNYFKSVVPKVLEFKEKFGIKSLSELAKYDLGKLKSVWKNERSWRVATAIASYLSNFGMDDRAAFRQWARNSKLLSWKEDPLGRIKGVGLVTYQYLRMMGGVDTVMPDRIVKRVINELLNETGFEGITDDIEFIKFVEELAKFSGYYATEICWITWFIQYEEDERKNYISMLKYI
jgi:hypothetical protein